VWLDKETGMRKNLAVRYLFVALLTSGVVAAQSVPSRRSIPAIVRASDGAIVSIIMSDENGKPIAQGSGFLVSANGLIVTNYHVIAEGNSAVVKLPDGAFFGVDGVLASDKARDLAVIKAHGKNFRTVSLGNSDHLQVGEQVVAIGNPLSLESTVSNGIVSGIRTGQELGGRFLQITAPISPGSSGGPLFNMTGEVVGITTLYLKGGENLNFAIPINDVKRLLAANFSKLQNLPNETESKSQSEPETREADSPPSWEQKATRASLVAKDEQKERELDPTWGKSDSTTHHDDRIFSHFDPKNSICFEIKTEVRTWNCEAAKMEMFKNALVSYCATYDFEIKDVIEGTKYALFNFFGNDGIGGIFPDDHPCGMGFVEDIKGNPVAAFGGPAADVDFNAPLPTKMACGGASGAKGPAEFWMLVSKTLGITQ
jgi:Trypsin-like peptidase domain